MKDFLFFFYFLWSTQTDREFLGRQNDRRRSYLHITRIFYNNLCSRDVYICVGKKEWPENHQNTCQFLRPVLGVRSFYDFFIKYVYDIHIFIFYYYFLFSFTPLSVPLKRSRTRTHIHAPIQINIYIYIHIPMGTYMKYNDIITVSRNRRRICFEPSKRRVYDRPPAACSVQTSANVWKLHVTRMNYNFFFFLFNSVIARLFLCVALHTLRSAFSTENSISCFFFFF